MPRPAAALCLALLAGCSRPDLVPAEPETRQLVVEVDQDRERQVDLLFVIDTSPSMVEEAAVVPLRVSEMVHVLLDPPRTVSGPEPPRLRDLHVGVVTADPADGGVLQPAGTWLTQEPDLMDERCEPIVRPLWEDVLRMADLGASGSSTSRPLEAAVRALTVQAAPGAPNEGFLREDSSLFVVVVTDGDDASPGTPERYHDELLALRPRRPGLVSVAVVAGIPTDGSWSPGDSIEALRQLDRDPGCEADHARASLPPRLAELAYLLRENGVLWSVCRDDWSPVAWVITRRWGAPVVGICVRGDLPTSPEEACRMVEVVEPGGCCKAWQRDLGSDEQGRRLCEVPPADCEDEDPETCPGWYYERESEVCPRPWHGVVRWILGPTPTPGSTLRFECPAGPLCPAERRCSLAAVGCEVEGWETCAPTVGSVCPALAEREPRLAAELLVDDAGCCHAGFHCEEVFVAFDDYRDQCVPDRTTRCE